jgi:hypothetical protein
MRYRIILAIDTTTDAVTWAHIEEAARRAAMEAEDYLNPTEQGRAWGAYIEVDSIEEMGT